MFSGFLVNENKIPRNQLAPPTAISEAPSTAKIARSADPRGLRSDLKNRI